MRPSWPPPMTPIVSMRFNPDVLEAAASCMRVDVGGKPLGDAGIVERDDARGEKRRVDRAADRHRRDRNAGRHLRDREQRIEPASALDCTGTPITGSERLRGRHSGQVRGAAGTGDDRTQTRACAADAAYSNISSGMRCAETTRISHGIPSSAAYRAPGASFPSRSGCP